MKLTSQEPVTFGRASEKQELKEALQFVQGEGWALPVGSRGGDREQSIRNLCTAVPRGRSETLVWPVKRTWAETGPNWN